MRSDCVDCIINYKVYVWRHVMEHIFGIITNDCISLYLRGEIPRYKDLFMNVTLKFCESVGFATVPGII